MIPNERSRELAKRKELAFALENVTEHKDYVDCLLYTSDAADE